MVNNPRDLGQAICTALASRCQGGVVDLYDERKLEAGGVPSPALLLDFEKFEIVDEDYAGDYLPVEALIVLYCRLSDTDGGHMGAQHLALDMADLLHDNRWGLDCAQPPMGIAIYPAELKPDKPGTHCWAVIWEQRFNLSRDTTARELNMGVYRTHHAEHTLAPAAPVAIDHFTLPQPGD